MSETNTTAPATWVRYRHRENQSIEYEVESEDGGPIKYDLGRIEDFMAQYRYYRIRTVRNLSYPEEVHIPAYTFMPCEHFLQLYTRVG